MNKYNGCYKFLEDQSVIVVNNGKYRYLKRGLLQTVSSRYINMPNKVAEELLTKKSMRLLKEEELKEVFVELL